MIGSPAKCGTKQLAVHLEQQCHVNSRASAVRNGSVLQSVASTGGSLASRYSYGRNIFSRSLDNPVITRSVTMPRVSHHLPGVQVVPDDLSINGF